MDLSLRRESLTDIHQYDYQQRQQPYKVSINNFEEQGQEHDREFGPNNDDANDFPPSSANLVPSKLNADYRSLPLECNNNNEADFDCYDETSKQDSFSQEDPVKTLTNPHEQDDLGEIIVTKKNDSKNNSSIHKAKRTSFNSDQLIRLEMEFLNHRYLTEEKRKSLSIELKLTETQVKIWYQNRRAKKKPASCPELLYKFSKRFPSFSTPRTHPVDE